MIRLEEGPRLLGSGLIRAESSLWAWSRGLVGQRDSCARRWPRGHGPASSSDRIQPSAPSLHLGKPPSHVLGYRGPCCSGLPSPTHTHTPACLGWADLLLTVHSPALAAPGSPGSSLPGSKGRFQLSPPDIGTDASPGSHTCDGLTDSSACLVPACARHGITEAAEHCSLGAQ